jgi:hypothetical protein
MTQLSDYLMRPEDPPAIQAEQTVAPATVTPVTKPEALSWMADDEFAEQSRIMPPDQLAKVYGNYDPDSAEPIYQTLYKSTQQKPTVPEERRIKSANTVSGITDALGMLVQGVTGAKGGLIPIQEQTATQNNNVYTQRMRDIYRQENDRYNAGLFNAAMRDIESGRQGHQANRAGLLNMLDNYRNRKYQSERDAARDALQREQDTLRREQFNREMEYKRDALTESVRSNKENEGIRRRQAEIAATRADAYTVGQQAKANGSGSAGTPKGYVDYLDPNTNTYYRVNEKKMKAFAPQIFKAMEQDVFRGKTSVKRIYDALSPNEQFDFVMKNWPSSPAAVQLMELIKDDKFSTDPIESDSTKKVGW